jgi:hypothetical protein
MTLSRELILGDLGTEIALYGPTARRHLHRRVLDGSQRGECDIGAENRGRVLGAGGAER